MSILERHADKWTPEPNTGCYLWTGSGTEKRGHRPRITVGKKGAWKTALITRIVCEEVHGPPPTSKHQAAHNTPNGCVGWFCVAPQHLRWATNSENQLDQPEEKRKERNRRMLAARWGT